jgi:hypothetical protein
VLYCRALAPCSGSTRTLPARATPISSKAELGELASSVRGSTRAGLRSLLQVEMLLHEGIHQSWTLKPTASRNGWKSYRAWLGTCGTAQLGVTDEDIIGRTKAYLLVGWKRILRTRTSPIAILFIEMRYTPFLKMKRVFLSIHSNSLLILALIIKLWNQVHILSASKEISTPSDQK